MSLQKKMDPTVNIRLKSLLTTFLFLSISGTLQADPHGVFSQGNPSPEQLVKAAYIYNFAKFVEWPPTCFEKPESPLKIAIVGRDPMSKALETLRGKTVQGRNIVVFRWEQPQLLAPCHILYIAASERKKLDAIFKRIAGWDVLTVGETEDFIPMGGIILFFPEASRIRFEINRDMASWKNLRISSHLMRLSKSPTRQ